GVTPFMALLAGFTVLLSRYSRQEDIVVGIPIASRHQIEVEELIGLFINTLVLRVDLSGNPSFRGLLAQVREVTLGAYAHQDLPFEQLVEALQPERDQSRSPLFNVLFTLRQGNMSSGQLSSDITLSFCPVENGTAKFDLTFQIVEMDRGMMTVV